jgi:hypothetical protein
MKCDIKTPISEVAEAIRTHSIEKIISGKSDSQQETVNRLQLFRNSFQTIYVKADQLKNKKIPTVDGLARVYAPVGYTDTWVEETFTTEGKINFEKKKGKFEAERISKEYESILKKESGTAIHNFLEKTINNLILTKYKDSVIAPSDISIDNDVDSLIKLPKTAKDNLIKTAEKLITDAIANQKEIDPNGKVAIFTEQILGDSNLMGTSDLIFVFSDNTTEHFDYKTINPKSDYKEYDGKYKLNSMSWIPFYKYEDWNTQLPKTTKFLNNLIGVKANRKSRIIPIQLEFKIKNKKLTDEILQIESFATADEFLDQIPVQETTGIENLDLQLEKLQRTKLNYQKEIQEIYGNNPRKEFLSKRINDITIAINKLIVNQDIRWLVNDYEKLVKKYSELDSKGRVKDLKTFSEEEDFEIKKELKNLIDELEALKGVLESTSDYYDSIGISEEENNKWELRRMKLHSNVGVLITKVKAELFDNFEFKEVTLQEFKNAKDISYVRRLFDTFSEIEHPAFKEAYKRISLANDKKRVELQQFQTELKIAAKKLEEYSKSTGKGIFGAYEMLINRKTGNLHNVYKSEFYEGLKKSQSERNKEFIDKHFVLKKDAEEKHKKLIERILAKHNLDLSDKKDKAYYDYLIKNNSLENLKFKSSIWKYYEIRPEIENEIYSEDYKKIKSIPELLEYYNFWKKSMSDLRKNFGFNNSYEKIPNNFIPNYRSDLIESLFRDGFVIKDVWNNLVQTFNVTNDDTTFGDSEITGYQNPDTGEVLAEIPKWGLNPIYSKDGTIDTNLKSYDLSKVLYTFAEVSLNYKHKKEIETEIDILQMMISDFGVEQTNKDGKVMKTLSGGISKLTGADLDLIQLYKKHIMSSLYGIEIQDKNNKELSKLLLLSNNFFINLKLAFEPVTQIGAGLSAKTNQYFEGVKGYYYSNQHVLNSEKMLANVYSKEGELTRALIAYIEPFEKNTQTRATELPSNKALNLSQRGLQMIGFRKTSEWIDNSIMLSMMQNYGIDENGNIKRLKNLENKKSLLDRSSIVNGELKIEDFGIEQYNQFRNMVRQVSRGIKGELTAGDQRAINMNIVTKLFMTFKNWLPDLYRERFSGIKYQNTTDAIVIGKLNAVWKSALPQDEKSLFGVMGNVIVELGKLFIDITTLGYSNLFKTSEFRLKQLFNKFKEENLNNEKIQNFTFEDFKDYYNGQVKSAIAELRIYLGFLALVMLLGADWDGDDEPEWKTNIATRLAYRTLNRIRREIGFFYGSEGLDILTKNSIPLSGLILTGKKFVTNTFDELFIDLGLYEAKPNEARKLHYFQQIVPGLRPFINTFNLDDISDKRDY